MLKPMSSGVALVGDLELLLGLFLLAVRADDLAAGRRASTSRTPRNFSFDRIAARCSADEQLDAVELDLLRMAGRDHAVVVGELAVDDLAHELDVGEAEAHLVREDVDRHRVVDVGQELAELEHRLARQDHFLPRVVAGDRRGSPTTADGRRSRPPAACPCRSTSSMPFR